MGTKLVTATGAGTFVVGTDCPATVTSLTCESWGAGGGGAGTLSISAPGGGGGGYSKFVASGLTPGGTIFYNVGAHGSGQSAGGNNGGNSWVNPSANSQPASNGCVGGGGSGGSGSGSSGPAGSGTVGTTNFSGGTGGNGASAIGGGGGGGAGSTGAGSNGTAGGGSGGAGGAGGTPDGGGGGNGASSNGGVGTQPGGGGGGGWSAGASGGNAADGQVRFTWTDSIPEADLTLAEAVPGLNLQVPPLVCSLALAGSVPGLLVSITVLPGVASLVLAGDAPAASLQVPVASAALALSGAVPLVRLNLVAPATALTLSAPAPTTFLGLNRVPLAASLVLSPVPPRPFPPPSAALHLSAAAPRVDLFPFRVETFYFAMVDADETEFGPEHQRVDADVLSLVREHTEANIPTATIEIKNPRVGLLNPGRKLWAWFSWCNPETGIIEPLLFGRLVGVPADTQAEVLTLEYVAKSQTYAIDRQVLSDTLRVLPGYDPLFKSGSERYDVDKVLDGYSKLYHVDPVTLKVTVSDVLIGEDGVVEFFEEDIVYDSLRTTLQQSPLTRVVADATVSWTQFSKGHIDLGTKLVRTYVGAELLGAWPKPYTAIGPGWSTRFSYAVDKLGTSFAEMLTLTNHFQNTAATHFEGDTMTIDNSWSTPSFDGSISSDFISAKLSEFRHNGHIDPGDPDSVDEPTSSDRISTFYALPWLVETYIDLEYEASRQRTERLRFELQSDLQAVVSDLESPNAPLGGTPDFEYVTLSGGDVARPQPPVFHWATYANREVSVGVVITPSNEASLQVCVSPGIAGSSEPTFSIIPGVATVDGGVTWACTTLDAPPLLGYSTHYILGQFVWAQAVDQAPQGFSTYPSQLLLCKGEGSTGTGLKGVDEVPFVYLPNGEPVPGPLVPPLFSAPVTGNAPTWAFLGSMYVPIMDPARSEYFTAGNGAGSYAYAIQRARSQLLIRSRAFEVEFECKFGLASPLRCRQNVVVHSPQLPGGVAQGKVVSVTVRADGEGAMVGTVKVGCAVGLGNSLSAVEGVPEYADDDYCDPDYQWYTGAEFLSDTDDVVAGALFPLVVDDGLTFPLTAAQAVIKNTLNGNADNQALKIAELIAQLQANSTISPFGLTPQQLLSRQITLNKLIQQIGFKQKADQLSQNLENTSVYFLLLKAVQNGPFGAEYNATGHMSVPLMVDLSASSLP